MAVLNHTIVAASDKQAAATFLTQTLGLPVPVLLGPFAVVHVSDDTTLDFMDTDGEIISQHYAFLVSESEFDEIFARIRAQRLPYWADPGRSQRDQINNWDDGKGLYFDDPNGHLLEHDPPNRQGHPAPARTTRARHRARHTDALPPDPGWVLATSTKIKPAC